MTLTLGRLALPRVGSFLSPLRFEVGFRLGRVGNLDLAGRVERLAVCAGYKAERRCTAADAHQQPVGLFGKDV